MDPSALSLLDRGRDLRDGTETVSAWDHRQILSLPTSHSKVPLHRRFEALELEGEMSVDVVESPPRTLPRVRWLTPVL